MIFVVSLISTLFILLILILLLEYRSRNRRALARRMRYYAGDMDNPQDKPKERKTLTERLMGLLHSGGKLLSNIRHARGLDFKMQQAGIPLLGTEFLVLLGISMIVAFFAGLFISKRWPIGLMAAVGIAMVEWVYVLIRIDRREASFTNQLGDCLMMVANAMRAGFSFLQAMELISKEMEPPISEEFKHVMRDISLGASVERALEDMDKRVGSPDFSLVVTAVLIQQQVGGDLARILDTISDTIQDRIRMRREVKTLTTQGRVSGWILVALPVALGLLLHVMVPGYMDILFEKRLGQMAIVAAIVMEVIGFFIIQRIVDIDV